MSFRRKVLLVSSLGLFFVFFQNCAPGGLGSPAENSSALKLAPFESLSLGLPETPKNAPRKMVIGLFGQSFAEALWRPEVKRHFEARLRSMNVEPVFVYFARGGSSAHELAEYPVGSGNYWWDLARNAPGPLLRSALSVIDASEEKPQLILWLQGEGNSLSPDLIDRKALYQKATKHILWELKKRSNPADPNSVATMMHVIGRRLTENEVDLKGVQLIREAQIELIEKFSPHFLADTWDLPLIGKIPGKYVNSHMNTQGNILFAERSADSVLKYIGRPIRDSSPRIQTLTSTRAGGRIEIRARFIAPVGNLYLPLFPQHLMIRQGAKLIGVDKFRTRVSGTTLILDFPANQVTVSQELEVIYPYGGMPKWQGSELLLDPSNIIRGQDGTPVEPFVRKVQVPN